jgi:polyhydroxybutyrate depolymerase
MFLMRARPSLAPLVALAFALVFSSACRRRDASESDAREANGAEETSEPGEPAPPPVSLGHSSLTRDGHKRTFAFYAPPDSPDGGKRALVVALHGRFGDGDAQERLSHLSKIAAREGFLLALPDGYRRSWHDLRETGPAAKAGYDDVGFLSDLVARFVSDYGADPNRVYFTGMSNGGFMSGTMACKLAGKVAAFAAVGATGPDAIATKCAPSLPVPALFIVGMNDPLVPYAGGDIANDGSGHGRATGAQDTARFWASANGCGASSTAALPDEDPNDGTRAELVRWDACKDAAEVRLVSIAGGGHTWPRGFKYARERLIGKTSNDFDASEMIWAFFRDKHR